MGLAAIGVIVAVDSLGYGIYAGQQANKSQQNAINNAQQNADRARQDQQKQYADQQQQIKDTTAANLAQEAQTKADTQAAQKQALAAEQAAIGTNSTTLSNSLQQQEQQALADQTPFIQDRLAQSGIADSGAYADALAKYQKDLASQAQTQLGNYQVGAQGQLTQDTNAASADQVRQSEQNALLNIRNQEQNMSQNFATNNANNQNNAAYDQYLTSLQLGKAQSQQAAANGYVGLGGQIGQGAIQYAGSQGTNPALQALYANNGAGAAYQGDPSKYMISSKSSGFFG